QQEAKPELRRRVPQLDDLLADLRGKVATLTVSSNVEHARVLVRAQQIGVTPLAAPVKLNAGHAVIEVIAEDYEPFSREVDLPGAAATAIEATLVAKTRMGMLVVKTSGEGTVSIDGKLLGRAPVEATLGAGSHRILVSSERYKDVQTTAVVAAGERRELSIAL